MRAIPLLALVFAGCAGTGMWTSRDSWHRPLPEGVSTLGWEVLDDGFVRPVSPERQPGARKRLEAASFVELSREDAKALAAPPAGDVSGRRPFLVRGVVLNEGTGGFWVTRKGGRMSVHHGCLGRRPVPMERRAVVVYLERPPDEVYVTCSMDE